MSRLFVIEAPMKARGLEATLAKLDFPARVQATVGHIYDMPPIGSQVGIDSSFRDFARKPRNLAVVERLRQEAQLAEDVYIATDADQEGDVIAWDVVELIRDLHPHPKRVRLKGMDSDSIRQAIGEAGPVAKKDAVGGRTRAIVDRLIGIGFSHDGIAVGRVSTALLGLVHREKPSTYFLRLVAPAKDGKRPWSAEARLKSPVTETIARKLTELTLPALDIANANKVSTRPGNMGDAMVKIGDRLDMSPKETSESMQRLYEGGRLSYPRAGSRGITPAVAAKLAAVLKKAGYKVEENAFMPKDDGDVHDSPYPIGDVNLTQDPHKLGRDEGVRAIIARNMVKAGQVHFRQTPVSQMLVPFLLNRGFSDGVAEFVAAMPWRREEGPRYPDQESWPSSELIVRRADVVLLESAVEAGLGRPSTWATHVEKFMSRGLVDDELGLSAKGRAWVAGSPEALLDPRVSAAIEKLCEMANDAMMAHPDREPWELNAERIVKGLPPTLRGVVEKLVVDERPRPRIDPIEAYGLGRSFTAEAIAASSVAPAYEPTFYE